MATVSSDFNAIAGVLTEDVYHRLIRPNADAGRLVHVGRLVTLGVGAIVMGSALWIAFSGQQALLELMVTVAGVFLAPSYLPLLAALIFRALTWKGALTGYCMGITSGFTMLFLRFYLVKHHTDYWMREFDGYTILLNTGITILGMWIGSRLLSSGSEEAGQSAEFFRDMQVAPERTVEARGPRVAIAKTTIAVGALIGVAGAASAATEARVIDSVVALVLAAIGVMIWRRATRAGGV